MAILSIISKLSHAYVLDLSIILIVLWCGYFTIILLSYRYFQRVKDLHKRVRRNFKLLDAVIKDVEDVSESGRKIDEKPNQLRDSQLKSGATLQLGDAGRDWVERTKTVVRMVKACDETYQKLSERRKFLKWVYSGFTDFNEIRGLDAKLGLIRAEIQYQLWDNHKEICKSLDLSRSIVRSLQDRPIVEQNSFTYKQAAPTVSIEWDFKVLITTKRGLVPDEQKEMEYLIMFQLHLLHAFLRDLEGLSLESETEKAWVEEAEHILSELQHDIHSIQKTAHRVRWLPYFRNWMARRQLRERFGHSKKWLRQLMLKKYWFGLKFIRRVPSKSVRPSPQNQTQQQATRTDDKEILDLLDQFHKQLNLEKPKVHSRLKKLADSFNEVHRLLIGTNKGAVEGMENSRKAWKEQMKIIVKDAITSLSLASQSQKSNSRRAWKDQMKIIVKDAITSLSPTSESQNRNSKMAWKDQVKIIVKDAITYVSPASQSQKSNTIHKDTDDHPWQKFSAEIERFEQAIDFLSLSIEECRIELREETNSVVGLEEDVHEMVSRLTANRSTEHFSTLSIVGMEGIGKTTLAKVVFNHKAIKNHFECRYWVSLPDHIVDHKNLLLSILAKEVMPNHDENENEKDYSFKEVKDFLKAKKYLLVLDKISNKETWDTLIEAFRDSKNGSRILLTTRDKSVASHAGSPSFEPYQIQLRNKNQSWVLFTQMVRFQPKPSQPDQLSSELKNLAEKVVKRCGGLPLCILSHGYLLSGKEVSTKELSRVLEHVSPYQTPWSDNLETNGKDLPPHLKKCLSYYAQFPRDYEISDRRLAALWVAEGMVKRSSDQEEESLKSVAEKYLAELIRRNLVQIVDGTLNRKFETCFFPATLRQLWLREHPSSGLDQQVLYYSFESSSHGHDDGDGDGIKSPNILQNCRNPRSMLCFDSREGDTPGEDIGIFLQKHIASGHLLQLKVLDLEHVFRPQLPKNIGKLIHLTYLGLRWTFLDSIPPSIGKLVNLETLDVKHSYIRTLPSSIWKLEKLQHLYMSDICRSKIEHQPKAKLIFHEPNTNFLQNLELLRGAFIDKDSLLKDALKKMKKLQILDLAFQLEVSEQNDLSESLEELQHLQELTLKSIDEMGQPQDLHVKHLSCLVNLSTLYLFGKLMNPSIIINLSGIPQSLTELTLSASELSDDPMPKLEKLHNLRSLCFYHGSYTGKKMVCSNGGFPELHVLKFWMLQELEEWNVQEHAMPSLKRLEIRSCKKLKVPTNHELRHLKSLRELKLKDMPVEFTKSIEKNKELIWGDIAFFPVIITE